VARKRHRFKVAVAHRETGEETELFIDARSDEEAAAKASEQGWMVSSVLSVPDTQDFKPRRSPGLIQKSDGARQFKVELVKESGAASILLGESRMPVKRLQEMLNHYGAQGWSVDFMFVEQRRLLLLFKREAVIVTLSRPE